MTVTDIKSVTKQKFQVELDGEAAFVLYRGELSRYSIEKGKELPQQVYRELVEEVLTKRAKLRAMHLLQKADKTKAELIRKLQQSGYPPQAVETAVSYVESFHYLDDARYASLYVQSQKEKKGSARLRMELLRKGISQELVQQALEELEETADPRQTIRELLARKRICSGPMEEKEKQRLYGFFMRKGFASADIMAVFREAEQESF